MIKSPMENLILWEDMVVKMFLKIIYPKAPLTQKSLAKTLRRKVYAKEKYNIIT